MMDCTQAREAISARIDGEREPVAPSRVDEHLSDCEPCRRWQAAAIEQTQQLRRLAGRSQLAAVRSAAAIPRRPSLWPATWQQWALGAVGLVQLALAVAQGLGAHLGLSHHDMGGGMSHDMGGGMGHDMGGGHILNESTAWSAALGVVMIAAALRPTVAAGLAGVLGAFAAALSVYVVTDAMAGRVTLDRILTHLPVVAGAVLALLVWRRARGVPEPSPDRTASDPQAGPVLPHRPADGRRPGSAA